MDDGDTTLEERLRSNLEHWEVPPRSLHDAMRRGRRRRRVGGASMAAGALLLVASIATPVALLAGLHRGPAMRIASRSVPPAQCVFKQEQPQDGIGCQAATAQAWRIASFLRSAVSAHAEL